MRKLNTLEIRAIWDDDAEVWVATCEDLPGLVVEADTQNDLENELKVIVPELLILNKMGYEGQEIPIHLLQERNFEACIA